MKLSPSTILASSAPAKACAPLALEMALPRRARQRMLGSLVALASAFVLTGCVVESDHDLGENEDIESTEQELNARTGTSTVFSAKHSGMCLDVWNGSTAEGALVKQGNCNGGTNQKLKLVPAGDSSYNLIFEHSNKCLEVPDLSTADGAQLRQWTCVGTDNQKFHIVDNYDGFHWLVAKHSGKCVDVAYASMGNGAEIQQYSCHNGGHQKFKLQGRTFYNIKPVNSGLCFDISGASTAMGAKLMQGNCHGGDNQRFELDQQANGYYRIVNKNSGLCLDIPYATTANGADVQQWNCETGDNQKFEAVALPNGRYALKAKHSGLCLDVWQASTANAAPIKQSTCHYGTNQQFTLDLFAPPEGTPSTYPVKEPYFGGELAYSNLATLKHAVAHDPTVTYNLAMLAHMLGFAWAGGTQGTAVGQGFDVSPSGDGYVLQARYNPSDPYASGYRSNERLKITLSDFGTTLDPATFVYGTPEITGTDVITGGTMTVVNSSSETATLSKALEYSLATTTSHAADVSFTESFSLAIENEAKIPFFGESTVTTEFGFESSQSYNEATSTTETVTQTDSYTGPIPPHTTMLISLKVNRTTSQIRYTAYAGVTFTVSFTGFLRTSNNARIDHPTGRPTVTVTFGNKAAGKSGFEDIVDQYDHRQIPGSSSWDWDWAAITYGAAMRDVMRFNRGSISTTTSGKFTQVKGISTNFTVTPL
ncbi:RICIN domain-containing protein [Polyangium sorediatum]|uniref:RICIN domain-containing protein n=1 Tax=Polyangium sorediatum TaxID=889274 RepID=A0ABT6NMJ3_9BACT|nr:RICIN domain-containing protein [Polyangium sorediatum]MDI1429552.1 RICIN domain-containing protein [Polyangium sorediatum]